MGAQDLRRRRSMDLSRLPGHPDWKLVAKFQLASGSDTDTVMIAQNQQLDCGIAFQGTSSVSEYLTSVAISFEDFCGEPRVHHGIASELRSIFKAFGGEIKETLRHCAKVYSIGHSLGGGLAEMFAFCANRHDPHNADYRLIGFDKDDKPTKLEEIDLTTCRGGRVLSK